MVVALAEFRLEAAPQPGVEGLLVHRAPVILRVKAGNPLIEGHRNIAGDVAIFVRLIPNRATGASQPRGSGVSPHHRHEANVH